MERSVVSWANTVLKPRGRRIQNYQKECKEGAIYLVICEILSGHTIGCHWHSSPSSAAEKRENMEIVVQYLEENNIAKPGALSVDDLLVDQGPKLLAVLNSMQGIKKGQTRQIKKKTWGAQSLAPRKRTEGGFDIGHDSRRYKGIDENQRKKAPEEKHAVPTLKSMRKTFDIGHLGESTPRQKEAEVEDLQISARRARVFDIGHSPWSSRGEEEPSWFDLEETDPEAARVEALKAPPETALKRSDLCVGIDLGDSYCRYSVYNDKGLDERIVKDRLRSAIQLCAGGSRIAEEGEVKDVIYSPKCIMGGSYTEEELENISRKLCLNVVNDSVTGRPVISVGSTVMTPEEVTAEVLKEVKRSVSDQIGEDVVNAVITVPAFFSNAQRQATMDAAKIAGFNVLRLVSETVVALQAQQATPEAVQEGNFCVVDFGSSKLDVSLGKSDEGSLGVTRTVGDTRFGGNDFDDALTQCLVAEFEEQNGVKLPPNGYEMRCLRLACQKARHELSNNDGAVVELRPLFDGYDFKRVLSRQELDTMLADQYSKLEQTLDSLLEGQELRNNDIGEVLLVGQMCNDPKVREIINGFFESAKMKKSEDNAVAHGVAVEAAVVTGVDIGPEQAPRVQMSTVLSLGFSLADGTISVLIKRGTPIPCSCSTVTTTFKDNQRNVGFDIMEGERRMAKDNAKLGDICVTGIEQAPKGVPRINVEFTVNEDGMLVVKATDKKTGTEIHTTIENRSNLDNEQLNQMVEAAEQHKVDDDRIAKIAEWRGRLEGLIAKLAKVSNCGKIVETARQWLKAHMDEQMPDSYIDQYFSLKKAKATVGLKK